jgi:MFS family permease
MTQFASTNTLIQAMVPERLRGRTMSIYAMMFMGMAPFGALLAGAIAERIGAPWTLALGGATALLASIVFYRHLPKIRVEARQMIIAQGVAGGEPVQEMTSRVVS